MEKHIVKILDTGKVTHNVKRFTVEKPKGYLYIPGQATDVSVNEPGFEDNLHPFTFTSLTHDDTLEFTIKIYQGVTKKMDDLNVGDTLILHEVFGAINYAGPGVFIAGGAGVTPFIAILRQLKEEGSIGQNYLLFANHSRKDIILEDEFIEMLGDHFINLISAEGNRVDETLLKQYVQNSRKYYVCGPDEFTTKMVETLKQLGAPADDIVIEQ